MLREGLVGSQRLRRGSLCAMLLKMRVAESRLVSPNIPVLLPGLLIGQLECQSMLICTMASIGLVVEMRVSLRLRTRYPWGGNMFHPDSPFITWVMSIPNCIQFILGVRIRGCGFGNVDSSGVTIDFPPASCLAPQRLRDRNGFVTGNSGAGSCGSWFLVPVTPGDCPLQSTGVRRPHKSLASPAGSWDRLVVGG